MLLHICMRYRRVCVCVTFCMRYIGGCWQPHTRAFDTGGGPEERGRWSSLFSLFKINCELPFPCSKVIGNSKKAFSLDSHDWDGDHNNYFDLNDCSL